MGGKSVGYVARELLVCLALGRAKTKQALEGLPYKRTGEGGKGGPCRAFQGLKKDFGTCTSWVVKPQQVHSGSFHGTISF